MKAIVIDASVAIKWFIPEIHSIAAARLLNMNLKLLAPDLIFAEVGNILWKKWRSQELPMETANAILQDFKKLPFEIYDGETLLDITWEIATTYQRTFYDSLYLALAQTEGCLLATADQALCNALRSTPLAPLLLWVEDIATPESTASLQD